MKSIIHQSFDNNVLLLWPSIWIIMLAFFFGKSFGLRIRQTTLVFKTFNMLNNFPCLGISSQFRPQWIKSGYAIEIALFVMLIFVIEIKTFFEIPHEFIHFPSPF